MRLFIGFIFSTPLTFLLLLFMSILLPVKAEVVTLPVITPPDISGPKYDPTITVKQPRKVPEKKAVVEQPQRPTMDRLPTDTPVPVTTITDPIRVDTTSDGMIFPTQKSGRQGQQQHESEAIPLMIKEPVWPNHATKNGQVKFCFTIQADGSVADIQLVSSEPGRLFVANARRALRAWKFKPAFESGRPISQSDMCYTMQFKYQH